MTRAQIRAARALLGWSQDELADRSGVGRATVARLEPGDEPLRVRLDTLESIRAALEKAGVIFIPANGDGPGVRLRRRRITDAEAQKLAHDLMPVINAEFEQQPIAESHRLAAIIVGRLIDKARESGAVDELTAIKQYLADDAWKTMLPY